MGKKDENNDFIDLREYFGKGVKIEEDKKSLNKREEEYFIGLIKGLIFLDERTIQLLETGVNITRFEDSYFLIIESLIQKCYGDVESEVIYWWVQQKQEYPHKKIKVQIGDGKEYVANTPKQLFKILNKIKNLK